MSRFDWSVCMVKLGIPVFAVWFDSDTRTLDVLNPILPGLLSTCWTWEEEDFAHP